MVVIELSYLLRVKNYDLNLILRIYKSKTYHGENTIFAFFPPLE